MTVSDYRRKIKTREELRTIIGSRPRAKTVVMCHGTFDLVHPGHIRHLMYAKSKADVLVASLTADAHVTKDDNRPYVPQDLRAMSLAAFEVVDYVIIDHSPTPLENLRYLEPDYFAKGSEYVQGGLHPKTAEEVTTLEGFGGKIIFTPADVVYSSSNFINGAPPNLASEKIVALLDNEGLQFTDLMKSLQKARGLRVHVVGDAIVDSVTHCTLLGGPTVNPTFSVKHEDQIDVPGGAAIVAKHFREAGAEVTFTSVFGADPLKDLVLQDLSGRGIVCNEIIDPRRPTTHKNVFTVGTQRMLKVDRVDNRPVGERTLRVIQDSIASRRVDAVVFSDFRHGIFNRQSIPALTACMPAGAFSVADSQVASRWGNILDFQDFNLITPNELEARFALAAQDTPPRALALELCERTRCQTLLLKRGEKGLLTCLKKNGEPPICFTLDSLATSFVDATGAGDALLAFATLGLMTSGSGVVASILGSIAAGAICEREINAAVTPDDIEDRLQAIEQRVHYRCES